MPGNRTTTAYKIGVSGDLVHAVDDRAASPERRYVGGVCGTTESTVGCVCCDRDHGMAAEPALLAGITTRPERSARPRSNRSDFVPLREVLKPPGAA